MLKNAKVHAAAARWTADLKAAIAADKRGKKANVARLYNGALALNDLETVQLVVNSKSRGVSASVRAAAKTALHWLQLTPFAILGTDNGDVLDSEGSLFVSESLILNQIDVYEYAVRNAVARLTAADPKVKAARSKFEDATTSYPYNPSNISKASDALTRAQVAVYKWLARDSILSLAVRAEADSKAKDPDHV